MVSIMHHILLLLPLFLHLSPTTRAATSAQPKALVIPVNKDTSTLQYIIKLNQGTPSKSIPLTLDLQGPLLWALCDHASPIQCGTAQCALTNSNCHHKNNTICTLDFINPFAKQTTTGELTSNVVRANSTDGSNPGKLVSAPKVLFGCGHTPLQGLAKGVKGIGGLGRSKLSLPSQLSSSFNFANKFTTCLTSNWSTGVILFGESPYILYPGDGDLTRLFSYTPLIANPKSPSEYAIGVSQIIVNQTTLSFPANLLTIDSKGNGGTKISTVAPYSVMHSSIYKVVTRVFDEQLTKYSLTQVKRVAAVAPFTLCYDINSLFFTRIGVQVPEIKLVMQNKEAVWRIFGTNSMVQVNRNVLCLGIVDGGINTRDAIIIGGYQLQDNLVQFDLAKSRLGFSSTLQYMAGTTCGNFNFTLV